MAGLMDEAFSHRGGSMAGLSEVGNMQVQRRADNATMQAQMDRMKGEAIGTIAGTILAGVGKYNDIMEAGKLKEMMRMDADMRRGNSILPRGFVKNEPMAVGSLPMSPVPQNAGGAIGSAMSSGAAAPASSGGSWWLDLLPKW